MSCEYAYAAGVFDGEGSVGLLRQKRYQRSYYVRLLIVNTHRPLLDWFQQHFEGDIQIHNARANPLHWKVSYQWRLSGGKAEEFLRKLLPYLKVKRRQAEVALRLSELREYEPVKNKNGVSRGRKTTATSLEAMANLYEELKALNKRGRTVDRPTREMLRQDITALDVPTVPKPALTSAKETDAYAPIPFIYPVQGKWSPPLDPDAGVNEVGRQMSGDPGTTYVVANGATVWPLPNED